MAKRGSRLLKEIESAGYIVQGGGRSHYKVFPSESRKDFLRSLGEDVDAYPAFIVVSHSSSDVNGERQARRDFRKIGYAS
jgi:hypothetical protein